MCRDLLWYRAGKDVFDLISDAEYLIGVEEARLPEVNPVCRSIVSRRLQRLQNAMEKEDMSPFSLIPYWLHLHICDLRHGNFWDDELYGSMQDPPSQRRHGGACESIRSITTIVVRLPGRV